MAEYTDGRDILDGDPDAPVYLHYSSSENITFHGSIETRVTVEDWNAMSRERQLDVQKEALWNLVDLTPSVDENESW